MCAVCLYISFVYDENLIAVFDSRQSVCDHDKRFSCNKLCNGVLQNCLILRICVCSRLIKDHDRSILKHGSCNRDPLSLTT